MFEKFSAWFGRDKPGRAAPGPALAHDAEEAHVHEHADGTVHRHAHDHTHPDHDHDHDHDHTHVHEPGGEPHSH